MRLDHQRLDEAIAGLPSAMDPYTPSSRQDTDMTTDTSKPAMADDIPQLGKPSSEPQPLKKATDPKGEGDGSGPGIGMMKHKGPEGGAAPSLDPTWEKVALPNKKDIGFKRTDGFFLRIREVESVPGKYLAQLWKDKEVLDKGQVVVPETEDPIKYIQGIADAMLDDDSERDQQPDDNLPPEEQAILGGEEESGKEAAPGAAGAGAGEPEEEFDLDDTSIQLDDDEIKPSDLPGEEEDPALPDLGL